MPRLTYLGSASQYPSPKRALNSLFLDFDGREYWLLDCGESTQTQFLKAGGDATKISNIFITHLHGDHSFGLPTMLLRISREISKARISNPKVQFPTIKIFGPVGLAQFVQTSLATSKQTLSYNYKIVEFLPLPIQYDAADKLHSKEYIDDSSGLELHQYKDFIDVECCQEEISSEINKSLASRDIDKIAAYCAENEVRQFPDGKYHLDLTEAIEASTISSTDLQSFYVVPLIHTVPSFGYVFVFAAKTILLYGDCCNSNLSLQLLNNCELIPETSKKDLVLMHESTLDDTLKTDSISKGHSCPEITCNFLKEICNNSVQDQKATLIMNHFSQRYVDDEMVEDEEKNRQPKTSIMVEQAVKHLGDPDKFTVYAARDLWSIDI